MATPNSGRPAWKRLFAIRGIHKPTVPGPRPTPGQDPKGFAASIPLAVLPAVLIVLATAEAQDKPRVNPATARIVQGLPLADLHFHPDQDFSPHKARDWMNRNGVRWAGAGVKTWPAADGRRNLWEEFSRELGNRFIPLAGQSELNVAYRDGGIAAMEDAENPVIKRLLEDAESDLRAGRVRGIGTVFINNSTTDYRPEFRRRARADVPSIRALYRLVAKYAAVMTVHIEGNQDSLVEFERLLAIDRRPRVIWNQCGSYTKPDQVRRLLDANENLFCELSWRSPPVTPPRFSDRYIFTADGPNSEWLRLIEDFSDRFILGNDGLTVEEYDGAAEVSRIGLLTYLSPRTARKVAYQNAQRVLDLKHP